MEMTTSIKNFFKMHHETVQHELKYFREMEEQRKKRKDADQDDGPEEDEVKSLSNKQKILLILIHTQ